MKPISAKKKGSRFELFVAKEITAEGLGKAGREANSGAGFRKGDIASNLPFLIECKNQRAIHILNWIDQSKRQAEIGNWSPEKWALVFRDPRTPEANPTIYAVVDFWELLKLFKKDSEPRIKEPDRSMKWHLGQLKDSINEVLRDLK